jgi:hypothetical protein
LLHFDAKFDQSLPAKSNNWFQGNNTVHLLRPLLTRFFSLNPSGKHSIIIFQIKKTVIDCLQNTMPARLEPSLARFFAEKEITLYSAAS